MKIQCDREKLLRAFQMVAGVVPARSPKPILRNAKLDVSADGATLMGTDLEVGMRIDLPDLTVEAPGSVVLPIDRGGAILREASDEKLSIESDGKRIRIEGNQSKFQLPCENPAEYPAVPGFEGEDYFEMAAPFFRGLIHRTVFATDNESTRYALGGVLLEIEGEQIIGVGTDGRRLARQMGPIKVIGKGKTSETMTIVPTRAMQILERALAENQEDVRLAVRDNDILVKSQKTTVFARLVEGRFPNWRGVFPNADEAVRIDLTAGPFYTAVRQASIVISEERRGVEFAFGEGKVALASHGAELGEAHIELPTAYDGPDISVKLDPRYVSDFLRVLEPDQAFVLELRDKETAAVCSTEDGYSYVIMPLARN
ncbi:MAG: DNA polymerase III subunit beta [Pirellulales bacterium]|nr:DNA polymerase III subunit beta [Pirellulales bacterium]